MAIMKWSGLILKLLLGILTIEILMLSILVYNSVRLLNTTHANMFERTVAEEIQLLSSLLVGGLSVRDRAQISDSLQLFARQENVTYAIVYDRRNRVMGSVGDIPEVFTEDKKFSQSESDGIYDTENIIRLDGQIFGVLKAGFSIATVTQHSKDAKFQNTLIAVTEIILSIISIILVGIYLINRITLLRKSARELQEGNYNYQTPVTSNDELGELASAYNQLGSSLARSKRTLQNKQDEIQQRATRYSNLINSVHAVIFEASADPFAITFVNEEAKNLLGYETSEWLDPMFLQRIVHDKDQQLLKQFIATPIDRKFRSICYRVWHKRKKTIWLRQITNIERGTGSSIINVILLDVTTERNNLELERARDIALAENRTKNIFMANMSHELRTPLNAIIGYSELLHDENDSENAHDKEMVSEDLGKITGSAKHLLGLINEILDIAKISSGKYDLRITGFEIDDLIKDIRNMVIPLADKNNNQLIINNPKSFVINADRQRLHQVVVNVCANACKFTHNGTIELNVNHTAGDNYYSISVKDNGIGIKKEDLQLIFQEFSRTQNAEKIEGTGLGLCLSQKLCNLMGGEIQVSSELNQGSTFSILMPVTVIKENSPPEQQAG